MKKTWVIHILEFQQIGLRSRWRKFRTQRHRRRWQANGVRKDHKKKINDAYEVTVALHFQACKLPPLKRCLKILKSLQCLASSFLLLPGQRWKRRRRRRWKAAGASVAKDSDDLPSKDTFHELSLQLPLISKIILI